MVREGNREVRYLFILVCYNNEEQVIDFVRRINCLENANHVDVIIVDNSKEPRMQGESLNDIRDVRKIYYYASRRNLGYYGGAHWGLKNYLCEEEYPDWVIVCNTDIEFCDNTILNEIKKYSDEIIAPKIISKLYGLDQNPYMKNRPSKLRMRFYMLIFKNNLISNLYQLLSRVKKSILKIKHNINSGKEEKPSYIYAPHGAFVIFNRKYFERGGSLDYRIPLFNEEIFIAETALSLGIRIKYEPSIRIIHKEHATTRREAQKNAYRREAAKYVFEKYFSY